MPHAPPPRYYSRHPGRDGIHEVFLDGTAPTDNIAAPGEEANPDQMLLGGHHGLFQAPDPLKSVTLYCHARGRIPFRRLILRAFVRGHPGEGFSQLLGDQVVAGPLLAIVSTRFAEVLFR
jgi:hypothetical protein